MIASGEKTATPFTIGIGVLGGLRDWIAIGLAFGITIATVIYDLGRISGAHINPAVSIALWATKRFPTGDMVSLVFARIDAASLGNLLFAASVGMDAVTTGGLEATTPFPGISYLQAIGVEFIGKFLPMTAIMGAAVDRNATPGFAGIITSL